VNTNKSSGSIRGVEFNWLADCYCLKKTAEELNKSLVLGFDFLIRPKQILLILLDI
jgi:hypothetical protein